MHNRNHGCRLRTAVVISNTQSRAVACDQRRHRSRPDTSEIVTPSHVVWREGTIMDACSLVEKTILKQACAHTGVVVGTNHL